MKATKRRPVAKRPTRRRNPIDSLTATERRQLHAAIKLSEARHGSRQGVVELDAKERQRAGFRFGVLVGVIDGIDYSAPAWSKVKGKWEHESGDRGWWGERSKRKPLLVVDPHGRHPSFVSNGSPMKLTRWGLEG